MGHPDVAPENRMFVPPTTDRQRSQYVWLTDPRGQCSGGENKPIITAPQHLFRLYEIFGRAKGCLKGGGGEGWQHGQATCNGKNMAGALSLGHKAHAPGTMSHGVASRASSGSCGRGAKVTATSRPLTLHRCLASATLRPGRPIQNVQHLMGHRNAATNTHPMACSLYPTRKAPPKERKHVRHRREGEHCVATWGLLAEG